MAAEPAPRQAGRPGVRFLRPPTVGLVVPVRDIRDVAQRMLLNLLRYGRAADITYRVAFLDQGPLADEVRALGVPVHVALTGHLGEVRRYPAVVTSLVRWIRRERLCGVISWTGGAHLYAAAAAALTVGGSRSVWFHHGVWRRADWTAQDRVLAALPAREVWCPSLQAASSMRLAAPRRPVRVIYPSVDLQEFSPSRLPSPNEVRTTLGLPARGPLVTMVADLARGTGVDTLLAATPRILELAPGAHVLVVGDTDPPDPAYVDVLRQQAENLGIQERILWARGWRHRALWLQAADVVVHAARQEPFGMAVVEAMALGKPLVAAANGGPLEAVQDGITGQLFAAGEPLALARAIGRYLAQPDWAQEVADRARARAQRFSAARIATEVSRASLALFA